MLRHVLYLEVGEQNVRKVLSIFVVIHRALAIGKVCSSVSRLSFWVLALTSSKNLSIRCLVANSY